MSGYIKLHRGWHESPMFKAEPYCERAAWTWLLSNAAWKSVRRMGGKGNEIEIGVGQIHVSDRSLASAWGWDKKRVRRFLAKLERSKSATIKRTTDGTVLSIENWAFYQGGGPTGGPTEGATEDRPGTTQEEGKEGKEEKQEGGFAFCGDVVRLTFADFRRWQTAYPDLDLRASLQARDDWLATQGDDARRRWFLSTSSWLAAQQSKAAREGGETKKAGVIW